MMGTGSINSATAKKLIGRLLENDFDPQETVFAEGLTQIRDRETIVRIIDEVLAESEKAVADYKNGKLAAVRALQGRAMAKTKGLADPVLLESVLMEQLSG
jgi:aspartyl-tRNA(Asn)/glutamyl-tRNA(Gln) amidotransferase subunit B